MTTNFQQVMNVSVSQIVTTESPVTCLPTATLHEVIEKMQKSHIGSVVVCVEKKCVGIFTERDLIMKVGTQPIDLRVAVVKDYMTPNPVTVRNSDPIGKVLIKMRMGRFRHILVANPKGELSKLISIKDVMDYLVDLLAQNPSEQVA